MYNHYGNWEDLIALLQDGQLASASNTNAPITDLAARTEYLKSALDQALLGEHTVYRNCALDAGLAVGTPVYPDATLGLFKAATLAYDNSNWPNPGLSSYARGVVVYANGNVGDVLVGGVWRAPELAAAVDGTLSDGPYYLAASGKLTHTRAPMAPFVLYYWAEEDVAFVAPQCPGSPSEHIHLVFDLVMEPAGTANTPAVGAVHTVATPDDTVAGWLPASHSVFGGAAPAGAKFGYNIAQHSELADAFPPVPVGGCGVAIHGGVWWTGRDPKSVLVIDNSGIWWMADEYGWAPWDSAPADMTEYFPLSARIWLVNNAVATSGSSVTSLQAAPGSALKFLNSAKQVAATGDLTAQLDLGLISSTTTAYAGRAVTALEGTELKMGPVVNVVEAGTDNVSIETAGGVATISFVDANAALREIAPNVVAFDSAQEQSLGGILHYVLPAGRASSITFRYDVPTAGYTAGSYLAAFKLRVLSRVAGNVPALAASLLRVPAAATPTAVPFTANSVDFTLAGTYMAAGTYVDTLTASLTAAPGDTLYFTLGRAASDTYAGGLGIIRAHAVITKA